MVALYFNRIDQVLRCALLQQHGRGADMQREQQQATEAEGKGQRRRAHEDVVGRRPQHVGRPADAGRDHVAVEVHGRLGLARGARGEGEDAGVVARRIDILEFGGLLRHRRFEAIGRNR
jgi:hypothetical protein